MKILIAPNSMKGSLSAFQFADLVEKGFQDAVPGFFQIRKLPVADGGDHTSDVLMNALGLELQNALVSDPLGRSITAEYGYANNIAVLEMANASGLKLLSSGELNPMVTSSFGTGELLMKAIQKGAKTIYLGIGGSATVDGGMGMLEAVGIKFMDIQGIALKGNGENTGKVNRIDLYGLQISNDVEIVVISDVDNPLLGPNGAARIFGPQKGATPQMVELLENNLTHFASKIKECKGKDVTELKSGGAAGGISVALSAFLNARILSGADFILDTIHFDEAVKWSDLVITGEGKLDEQTLMNKAPYAVALRARKFNKKVIGLAGSIELETNSIFDGLFPLMKPQMTLNYAMEHAAELVYHEAQNIARQLHQKT